jgi:hypothetical protein
MANTDDLIKDGENNDQTQLIGEILASSTDEELEDHAREYGTDLNRLKIIREEARKWLKEVTA